MIFLQNLKYQEIQNILPAVDMTHYNRFVGGLYQAQEEAVQIALQFQESDTQTQANINSTRWVRTSQTLISHISSVFFQS